MGASSSCRIRDPTQELAPMGRSYIRFRCQFFPGACHSFASALPPSICPRTSGIGGPP